MYTEYMDHMWTVTLLDLIGNLKDTKDFPKSIFKISIVPLLAPANMDCLLGMVCTPWTQHLGYEDRGY